MIEAVCLAWGIQTPSVRQERIGLENAVMEWLGTSVWHAPTATAARTRRRRAVFPSTQPALIAPCALQTKWKLNYAVQVALPAKTVRVVRVQNIRSSRVHKVNTDKAVAGTECLHTHALLAMCARMESSYQKTVVGHKTPVARNAPPAVVANTKPHLAPLKATRYANRAPPTPSFNVWTGSFGKAVVAMAALWTT